MKRPENQRLRLLLGAQVFLGVAGIAGFFFFRRRGRQACAMKILAATNWTASAIRLAISFMAEEPCQRKGDGADAGRGEPGPACYMAHETKRRPSSPRRRIAK